MNEGEQDGRLSRHIRECIVPAGPYTPIQFAVLGSAADVQSAALRPWRRSLPSDGTAGEVAAAGCGGVDPADENVGGPRGSYAAGRGRTNYSAVQPPSIDRLAPVIAFAASEQR